MFRRGLRVVFGQASLRIYLAVKVTVGNVPALELSGELFDADEIRSFHQDDIINLASRAGFAGHRGDRKLGGRVALRGGGRCGQRTMDSRFILGGCFGRPRLQLCCL